MRSPNSDSSSLLRTILDELIDQYLKMANRGWRAIEALKMRTATLVLHIQRSSMR
jgi:hypothetical protein